MTDRSQLSTAASNQIAQSDVAYLQVNSGGWLYLSTIMDDHSLHPGLQSLRRTGDKRHTPVGMRDRGSGIRKRQRIAATSVGQWTLLRPG